MKLMNLPHIAILPYLTCNFKCPYCVAETPLKIPFYSPKTSLVKWDAQFEDTVAFLNSLDTKAIEVSGGEPFLWKKWGKLIERTSHYWEFLTNASLVPDWLKDGAVKERAKLFIAAFHRKSIRLERFIDNVHKIQDLGYPVFVKVVYTKESEQLKEIDKIIKAGIPASLVPLLGMKYSKKEVEEILPYCQSALYAYRFIVPYDGVDRKVGPCVAGTKESFELDGAVIVRCSHYSAMSLNKIPKLFRGFYPNYLGDVKQPSLYYKPEMCYRTTCTCEWMSFTEIVDGFENEKWQHFIETGEWVPATMAGIEKFVAMAKEAI